MIAAPAAQKFAAVRALGSGIAFAAPSAHRARPPVSLAEVGRLLRVDEIFLARRLDCGADGQEDFALAVVHCHHFRGAVELVFEAIADVTELRQLPPAGLECARARHAVTLANSTHVVSDSLLRDPAEDELVFAQEV